MLKVVVHSYFDMFTYKAMGGAAFLLSYAVLLTMACNMIEFLNRLNYSQYRPNYSLWKIVLFP